MIEHAGYNTRRLESRPFPAIVHRLDQATALSRIIMTDDVGVDHIGPLLGKPAGQRWQNPQPRTGSGTAREIALPSAAG